MRKRREASERRLGIISEKQMTEVEKMNAGLEYDFSDPAVFEIKKNAVCKCARLNRADPGTAEWEAAIRDLFGSVGKNPSVFPEFHCDSGFNIHAGDDFLANYNVTILDVGPVHFGNNVMIGPGTLIATVNHPISPEGRRLHRGIMKPVAIGNDVWIGGNVTIVPGVTIGNNVVIGAGSVVTTDIPDNSLAVGDPAKVIRSIPDDTA